MIQNRVTEKTGPNDPADCDYPFCGCSEEASSVIETLQECGWGDISAEKRKTADLAMLLRRVLHYGGSSVKQQAWDYLRENNLLGSPLRSNSESK